MDKQDRKSITDAYKERRAVGGVFAVSNTANGKRYISATTDIQGSRNRFEFSLSTGGCSFKPLQDDCKTYGNGVFVFEVLEELTQKEGQTDADFRREIEELLNIITEGMDKESLY